MPEKESPRGLLRLKLDLITDSYRRMATNRDDNYRNEQEAKCRQWLEEITVLFETHPRLLSVDISKL